MISVLCGTPGDVEPERQAFYAAVSECNEAEGIPRGVLYVPLSLLPTISKTADVQTAMDYNIRLCAYYILVLAETWGSPQRNFECDYRLAIECRDDPSLPMKEVVVFQKNLPPGQQLETGGEPRHFHFADTAEFAAQVRALLSEWLPPALGPADAVLATPAREMTSDDEIFVHDLIVRAVSDQLGASSWPEPMRAQLLEIQYNARRRSTIDNYPGAMHEILLRNGVRAGWAVIAGSENEILLVDIIVAPEYRGKGIATARIRELLADSDRTGKPVRLSVAVTNRAIELYQRLGFRPTGGDGVRYFLERPPAGTC